ncbi:MAG: type II CAAX endopeptidase family protein [Candidatus Micrarchaeota archaeon]
MRGKALNAKIVFLAGFLLSILFFIASFVLFKQNFLYEIFVHTSFIFAGLYLVWNNNLKDTLKSLGLPGNLLWNIIWSIAGFLAIIVMMVVISLTLMYFGYQDNAKVFNVLRGVPSWILVLAVVGAPISEELLFRAGLIGYFERTALRYKMPPALAAATAVVFSSLIFGSMHIFYGSVSEIVGATFIGLVLALVYKRSGSLLPPMIIHFLFNLMSIAALIFGVAP